MKAWNILLLGTTLLTNVGAESDAKRITKGSVERNLKGGKSGKNSYDDYYYADDYTDDYSYNCDCCNPQSNYYDDYYCGCSTVDCSPPDKTGCFSEKTMVQVLRRGAISVKDLQVGDHVLTGEYSYEPVYGFGHLHDSKDMDFLKIFTFGDSTPLEITGNHLIFVDGKDHPVRADSLQVGDLLRADHETVAKITKIKIVTRKGVYAPLTPSGSIVVNGILASTYISLQEKSVEYAEFSNGVQMPFLTQNSVCHAWMSPLRLLCMGVSSRFCKNHDEDGQLFWVHFGQDFVLWGMEEGNMLVQALLLGATMVFIAGFNAVEFIFGARWGIPMIVVALVGVIWMIIAKRSFGISLVIRQKRGKMA